MTLLGLSMLLTGGECLAYIGPGPGLSMIGVLIGLVATLLAAFWAVALWPLRALLRRRREGRQEEASQPVSNG